MVLTSLVTGGSSQLEYHPHLEELCEATRNFFRQFGVPYKTTAQTYAEEALRVIALLAENPELYTPGMLPHLLLGIVTQQKQMKRLPDLVENLPSWSFCTVAQPTPDFEAAFLEKFHRPVLSIDLRNFQIPLPSLSDGEASCIYSDLSQNGPDSAIVEAIRKSYQAITAALTPEDKRKCAQTLALHFDWEKQLAESAIAEAMKALAIMSQVDATPSQGVDQGWHVIISECEVCRKLAHLGAPEHGTTANRQIERSILMASVYAKVFGEPDPVWKLDLWGKPTGSPASYGDCYSCS